MNNELKTFPVLTTERLILRKLQLTDSPDILMFQSDKNNFIFADLPIYNTIDQVDDYINKMNLGVKEHKWFIWALCLKESNQIIGSLSIWNLNHKLNKAELGYLTFTTHRKKGYMKEALKKVLDFAFNTLSIDIIEAYTRNDNVPSKLFLNKLEFKFTETIEDDYSNGALMDIFVMNNTSFQNNN